MDTTVVVVIIILIVAVVLTASVILEISRRRLLRQQERTAHQHDDAGEAASEERHGEPDTQHEQVRFRTLPPETRRRYRDEWNGIQRRFGEVPGQAVQDADRLVQVIMREVGYPMDDFERRAPDLSVDHPQIVRHYRSAHSVAAAQLRGQAGTEPLRQAAVDYRVLVDDLLEQGTG